MSNNPDTLLTGEEIDAIEQTAKRANTYLKQYAEELTQANLKNEELRTVLKEVRKGLHGKQNFVHLVIQIDTILHKK